MNTVVTSREAILRACRGLARAEGFKALTKDPQVRPGAFDAQFTPKRLVDWAFSDLMALLVQGAPNCDTLLELLRRAIY